MASPNEENIYDTQGTVLYRVVRQLDHEREMTAQTLMGGAGDVSPPLAQGTTASGDTHIRTYTGSLAAPPSSGSIAGNLLSLSAKKTSRLVPLRQTATTSGSVKHLSATATGTAAIAGAAASCGVASGKEGNFDSGSLTAVKALARLIPPTPVHFSDQTDNTEGTPRHTDITGAVAVTTYETGRGGQRATSARVASASVREQESSSLYLNDCASCSGDQHVDNSSPFIKVASLNHISRLDAVLLQQHLENRCWQERARQRGVLCPTRELIYNDGMREVMRQITVTCPERGLLLDDLCKGMTQATETYDVLFDSACQYAVRKSIERDLRSYLFDEKLELESEVRRLENRVSELRAKYEGMMKRFEEQKSAGQKLHEEEVAYLKKANQQFAVEIKRITALENPLGAN